MKIKIGLIMGVLLFWITLIPCYAQRKSLAFEIGEIIVPKDDRSNIAIPLFVIGAVILIISGIIHSVQTGATKKCPCCANDIKKDAIICQYCNNNIT